MGTLSDETTVIRCPASDARRVLHASESDAHEGR